jgi:drug/metabolite transporter (DMT)-like permease
LKRTSITGTSYGLTSGLFWAIDTILIGLVLSLGSFTSTEQIIFVAPLLATFLHDFTSVFWMMILLRSKGELGEAFSKIRTRDGRFVMLAALLGGPIGMTFYVLAVQYIGPSYTASISSVYPAVGAFFGFLILRDRLSGKNWMGLLLSITCIFLLSYSSDLLNNSISSMGLIFALICVFGWGMESVIVAYGMKDENVKPEHALLIRQLTSSVIFGFIIIPVFASYSLTIEIAMSNVIWLIAGVSFFGTLSYVYYYKGIALVGPVRAMALNISYAAFAIILDVMFFDTEFSFKSFLFALLIIAGAVLTVMDSKKAPIEELAAGKVGKTA